MRFALREGFYPNPEDENGCGLRIHRGHDYNDNAPSSSFWQFDISTSAPSDGSFYVYSVYTSDRDKFYENGRIYNKDGSVAINFLLRRKLLFHDFLHSSLDDLLRQPDPHFPSNFMYGVPVANLKNLKVIELVRNRLKVPDWLALLVVANIVDEDSVRVLTNEVPGFFNEYPVGWVFHALNIKPDDLNRFGNFVSPAKRIAGNFQSNRFDNFCKIIELEKDETYAG